jgi:hypothetical protein
MLGCWAFKYGTQLIWLDHMFPEICWLFPDLVDEIMRQKWFLHLQLTLLDGLLTSVQGRNLLFENLLRQGSGWGSVLFRVQDMSPAQSSCESRAAGWHLVYLF